MITKDNFVYVLIVFTTLLLISIVIFIVKLKNMDITIGNEINNLSKEVSYLLSIKEESEKDFLKDKGLESFKNIENFGDMLCGDGTRKCTFQDITDLKEHVDILFKKIDYKNPCSSISPDCDISTIDTNLIYMKINELDKYITDTANIVKYNNDEIKSKIEEHDTIKKVNTNTYDYYDIIYDEIKPSNTNIYNKTNIDYFNEQIDDISQLSTSLLSKIDRFKVTCEGGTTGKCISNLNDVLTNENYDGKLFSAYDVLLSGARIDEKIAEL